MRLILRAHQRLIVGQGTTRAQAPWTHFFKMLIFNCWCFALVEVARPLSPAAPGRAREMTGNKLPGTTPVTPTGSCQRFEMIHRDLTVPMASPTRRAPRLAAARSRHHQSQEHHVPTLHTERLHNSVQNGQKNGHRVCKVRPVPEVRTRPRGACPVLPLARPSPGHDIRAEISTSPVPCVTPHRNCETLVGW
jgi:hypothetical protein